MLTSEAVTGAGGIVVGYTALALVYLGVACGVVWILRRLARAPLGGHDDAPRGHDPPPLPPSTAPAA
jgi:cytochrome d ubiquinol oxidase subunit I